MLTPTELRLRELYYRKFGKGKMKKKKIYKKALKKICAITPEDLRIGLGLKPRGRDLEIAKSGAYIAIEIAATALSGKRTEEK